MEGLPKSSMASDDFLTHNGNETLFSIEDVELEAFESTSLGDTQDAREDHGVADLKIGKTSLDVVFTKIVYGLYKGRPACLAMIDFTVRSDTNFRVKSAVLTCTVASEATNNLQVSSSDVVRPSVLKTVPRELNDDNPTEVGVAATRDFSPNVTIPNGPGVSAGSFTLQKTYTETYGWHLHSSVWSSDEQNATSRDSGTWNFTANRMQKDSKLHLFSTEVLIRHAGQPFYADFQLEATLAFGASFRTIGKKKKIQTRRRFSPFETSIVFS